MPDFLVIVFWLWFAAGALILLHRLVTTGTFRPGGKKERGTTDAERQATAERHAAFEAQLAAFAPAEPSRTPAHQRLDGPPSATAGDVDVLDPAPVPASLPASPSNPDGLLPAAARVRTLVEALDGIHMPADLVPIPDDRPDPRHVFFATETTSAAGVAEALADELERIGFELVPIDDRSVQAVRPTARIEIRILPDDVPGVPGPFTGRITPGSVVVEFQLT